MTILLAFLILLPSVPARHHGDGSVLEPEGMIRLEEQLFHHLPTGGTYLFDPGRGTITLRRSRLPCPSYLVSFIGERFLAAKTDMQYGAPPRLADYSLWYHFPGDTGWVPVNWVPPCYLVPDWEAWRIDQARVDRELEATMRARDEQAWLWERK